MFSDEDEDDENGGDGEIEILCPRMSARRIRKKHNTVIMMMIILMRKTEIYAEKSKFVWVLWMA